MFANRFANDLPDIRKQFVTCGMPGNVVDLFELIELALEQDMTGGVPGEQRLHRGFHFQAA